MCFARQRWRCSRPNHLSAYHRRRIGSQKTHALTNLERHFATHLLYYLSYQRAKACTRWRETNKRARGVDVGTRLCNERAERLQRAVSARWSTLQGRHMSTTWFLSCGVSDTGKGTFNEIRHVTVRFQTISAARRQAKFPLEQANIFGCPATASFQERASAGSLQNEHALWMCQGPAFEAGGLVSANADGWSSELVSHLLRYCRVRTRPSEYATGQRKQKNQSKLKSGGCKQLPCQGHDWASGHTQRRKWPQVSAQYACALFARVMLAWRCPHTSPMWEAASKDKVSRIIDALRSLCGPLRTIVARHPPTVDL